MKAFVITILIGCFGVDEKNNIITFKPFSRSPEKIAKKLSKAEAKVVDEEKQVVDELKKRGFAEFVFNLKKPGVKVEVGTDAEQFVKSNLRKLAIDYGFVKDQEEFNQLLTAVNIELAKEKMRKAFQRDSLIVQANNAIEEVERSINILIERLREFYSLHFPELDKAVPSHERFAKLVEKFGSREKIEDPEVRELAKESIGAEFREEDIRIAQSLATQLLNLFSLRKELISYMEKGLNEVAPNFSEIATPAIAAKLLARVGSLEKLAKMASSTIQLIGAEKSLFRYLRGRGRGPRFGILALHPLVQSAPEKLKGRIARAIASKLSIAAKLDFYSKEYRAKQLKEDLDKKIKEILRSS